MKHRPPTRFDIGREVEVRNNDREKWQKAVLRSLEVHDVDDFTFWTGKTPHSNWTFWWECRVPYDCPDTQAELAMAADWLAERGLDEAARVVMAAIEERTALYPPEPQP